MKSTTTAWQLTKSSWKVLTAGRALIVLPVMWAATVLATILAFGYLVLSAEDLESRAQEPIIWLLAAVGYGLAVTVSVFFKAALAFGAHQRLTGGHPTTGSALRGAARRLPRLSRWALIAILVGLFLNAREQLDENTTAARTEWLLLTYLVIPVMVIEDVGVIEAYNRMDTFRDVSGVEAALLMGLSLLVYALVVIPGVVVLVLASHSDRSTPLVICLAVATCLIAIVAGFAAGLLSVLQAAIYQYARSGELPAAFARV